MIRTVRSSLERPNDEEQIENRAMNATYRLESEIVGVDDDGDNVVLATESRSSGNGLSIAIDEEGDAPLATDTPADKL